MRSLTTYRSLSPSLSKSRKLAAKPAPRSSSGTSRREAGSKVPSPRLRNRVSCASAGVNGVAVRPAGPVDHVQVQEAVAVEVGPGRTLALARIVHPRRPRPRRQTPGPPGCGTGRWGRARARRGPSSRRCRSPPTWRRRTRRLAGPSARRTPTARRCRRPGCGTGALGAWLPVDVEIRPAVVVEVAPGLAHGHVAGLERGLLALFAELVPGGRMPGVDAGPVRDVQEQGDFVGRPAGRGRCGLPRPG